MTFGPANTQTSYLPPEQDFPEDIKLYREILANRERLTATILNIKENAQYEKRELLTAQQWFSSVQNGAIKTSYTLRLTFDLVALNGGPIGAGATVLTLTTTTQPPLITVPTAIQPVHGFGAAFNGTAWFFINDPLVFVRTNNWTSVLQQLNITNNTGANLTIATFVMEYIKT